MTDNDPISSPAYAGDTLFEAFVEQVKQVLEHLYDFAYLQQHSLARVYDGGGDLSAKTAGRQLRHDLIKIIESLKPNGDTHFRAPVARLYNLLHLYYVENLTIQEAAIELGLSERQAYRDLRRGQENVAAVLWDKRLPDSGNAANGISMPEVNPVTPDFSFESEIARLKVDFGLVDFVSLFWQAKAAVERLAQQQAVEIRVDDAPHPMMLSTDAAIAHQVMVSLLSFAIQQASSQASSQTSPNVLNVTFASHLHPATLTMRYRTTNGSDLPTLLDSLVSRLAQRIRWQIFLDILPDQLVQITLHTQPEKVKILIIDDNDGWIELLQRFVEGYDCLVVTPTEELDAIQYAQEFKPTLIILDVMMPKRDGWELLQRLRAQPTTANVPIIVCSVFNDPQLAYSLGATAFVAKPTNQTIILETFGQLGII